MKKKILVLALAAVFVSLLALGSAAYFTVEGRATNIITTGTVSLSLDEHLEGPSAFAFGMNDPVSPAKVVYDFVEKNKTDCISVKAGLMGTEIMDEKAVKALSLLPSREVLLARLVGSLKAPISNLVYALEALRKKQAGEE